MYRSESAFLFWLLGCIGLCGLHRFYLAKPYTGLIWLLTGGLLGLGQVVDLFFIPAFVAQANQQKHYTRAWRRAISRIGAVSQHDLN